jgi:EAL domain-containing protein (putative c-di-GMP-specific phosphodiesterase class I)
MSDVNASANTLLALRDVGVHLSVDDFGTGYGSLTYLRRYPVEGLKIDRSFVAGLDHSVGDASIVDALVRLGRALGLTVVAEGIETVEQADVLRASGCQYGQGYLYARPAAAEVTTKLLWRDEPRSLVEVRRAT